MSQVVLNPVATVRSENRWARDILLVSGAVLMGVTLYLVFLWVPTERSLGVSYRILFFHVPVGWIGMVSILVVAIASVMHLFTEKDKWDSLAYATAELGVIFASLIIVTGSIWAKPTWGVWWTWDPKLTTTLILWFVYAGYLMVRAYGPKGAQGARYGAVVALIGAIGFAISGTYLNINAPLSLGFINIPTFLIFIPITTFMAKIGAETVHKFNKRLIGRIFGIYLFIVSCKLFYDYFSF